MAIGLTPKFIENYSLDELSPQHFLVLAAEAVKKLGWDISFISDSGIVAYTNNGMFSPNAEIRIAIDQGTAMLKSASTGSEMIDLGRNKKNIQKLLEAFEEARHLFNSQELDEAYDRLKVDLARPDTDIFKQATATTTEQITGFLSLFKPTKSFFVTPILLDLNILVFIAMVASGVHALSPDNESLLMWGANFQPTTLDGEPWRLLTSCFLHIGVLHLLMNMYALLYIGVLLEPLLGKARFISAYLLSGICGSVASMYWHNFTVSAGASGAIFGMYGVFLALLTTSLIEKNARKALLTSITVFVGYNLVNGMNGNIDNAAHIGGLISGLAIGYAFIPSLRNEERVKWKYITIALLTVFILSSSFGVYMSTPNLIGIYEDKMKEFVSMESMAMEAYSLPPGTPKEEVLYALKDRGIYFWEENIRLLKQFEGSDFPLELRTRNRLLKEYCDLRIESYGLMYKAVSENSDEYRRQIEELNRKIDSTVAIVAGQ